MNNTTGKWMRILSIFLAVLIISTGMAERLITVVAAEINTEGEPVSTMSTDVSPDTDNVEIPAVEENVGPDIEEADSSSENESNSNEQPAEEEPSGEASTIPTETADIMESSEEVTSTEETISIEETESAFIEETETTESVSMETETEISVSENSIRVQKSALLTEKVQGEPCLEVILVKEDESNSISLVSSDENDVIAEDWAYDEIRTLKIQGDFTNTEGIKKIEIEMNSVTDNPIIFPGENQKIISGGNFHGEPMALAFDFLGIALSEIANISERRLEKMVNPALSHGLPAFLVNEGGVNSGFMIVQYSAASLVSENKVLAHPASVDSIPSSANQEDHVSMGTIASRHARDILDNARKVLAMEILASAQAIDLRGKKKLGKGTEEAYKVIRERTPFVDKDRIMYKDINICEDIIKENLLVEAVEKAIGKELLVSEEIVSDLEL